MPSYVNKLIVETLTREFQNRSSFILVNFQGLKASQNAELRKTLRKDNLCMRILPNRLARIAFRKEGKASAIPLISGNTALLFDDRGDVARVAKKIVPWIAAHKVLQVQGGILEGGAITPEQVRTLADLPSREVLYASVASGILSPMTHLAVDLKGILQRFVVVVDRIKTKKAETNSSII